MSIWHTKEEVPDRNEMSKILLITLSRDSIGQYETYSIATDGLIRAYMESAMKDRIVRWAYIADIEKL